MDFSALIADTMAEYQRGLAPGMRYGDPLGKAGINVATGLIGYDLEKPPIEAYPALAPIVKEIPRVGLESSGTGMFGVAVHTNVITNINTGGIIGVVSEGNRGAAISRTEVDQTFTFKGLGLEDYVTAEAQYSALGYDDLLALAQKELLQALMVEEEKMCLLGNLSLAGGTTPTPIVSTTGSGGAFVSGSAYVYVTALTPLGLFLAGGPASPTAAVLAQAVVDTQAQVSAGPYANTHTILGGHNIMSTVSGLAVAVSSSIVVSLSGGAGVAGAAAYAWYVGQTTGAGSAYLAAITTTPVATFTAAGNSSNQASNYTGYNSDRWKNALGYDGLIYQALECSGYGTGGIFNPLSSPGNLTPGKAYARSLNGAALTGTAGVVNEIDSALLDMWDVYRLWPDEIWVSARQAQKLSNLALASAAPLYQIQVADKQGMVIAGNLVVGYINKFSPNANQPLPIRIHPYMPDGWIFFNTKTLAGKYPTATLGDVSRIVTRRDYYSVPWPLISRKNEYGMYADETLVVRAPFALGLLQDVG